MLRGWNVAEKSAQQELKLRMWLNRQSADDADEVLKVKRDVQANVCGQVCNASSEIVVEQMTVVVCCAR